MPLELRAEVSTYLLIIMLSTLPHHFGSVLAFLILVPPLSWVVMVV
jgi:hypothetical protein